MTLYPVMCGRKRLTRTASTVNWISTMREASCEEPVTGDFKDTPSSPSIKI